ncbi:alpha/beta fold hydrolase [Fodinicola feengrottensis]|uniref:Alpha/beta hydrolase n=1 Tax=Fodinicola feengrottensis TaxID=435914 RepID=A0ABN2GBP6_9ACTN|nr:alpha/beta hydrolase [Fodinicola feengrottensis]
MSRIKNAGLIGGLVGVAAAGVAAGLAVERFAVGRVRKAGDDDPYATEPFGLLPADQERIVTGPDGVELYTEIVEPDRDRAAPELTVVFVHGFCLDMGTWHFQRRGLSRVSDPRFRMVFYDQPGHGRSSRKPSGDYSIDELGGDLAALIAQVAPKGPLVLIGHSMGGMTIMALAEQDPELFADRVVGVGLIATSAGDLDSVALGMPAPLAKSRKPLTPALTAALKVSPGIVDGIRRLGSDVAWLLTRRYAFADFAASPSLVSYVERMISSTSSDIIAGYLRTLSEHHRYAALEVVDGIETLVVAADDDLLTPVQHSEEMVRLLPGAEFVELESGGHLALMAQADIVNANIAAFLQRALRSAGAPRTVPESRIKQARSERAKKAKEAGSSERRRFLRVRRKEKSA